jgi:hypothetical protein
MNFRSVNTESNDGRVAKCENQTKLGTLGHAEIESDDRLRLIELTIEILIAQARIGRLWSEGYREVRGILEAIPLPVSEFAACVLHLDNALRYCNQTEFGAAAFELRMLRGILQKL